VFFASPGYAQIDPEERKLLQLGINQSLHNDGPPAAYAFYYWNQPGVPATNMTLRLAIAPVYLDGELGFKGLLGENTDLGMGVFGGGFYNSYHEVRQGDYHRDESFDGHGGGATLSLYQLLNPGATAPLVGLVRAGVNYQATSHSTTCARACAGGAKSPCSAHGWRPSFPPGMTWSTARTMAPTALETTGNSIWFRIVSCSVPG
jgi:hypothetical protein